MRDTFIHDLVKLIFPVHPNVVDIIILSTVSIVV